MIVRCYDPDKTSGDCMDEQVARKVTMVRAIETADGKHEVLSEDDRMYASRSARELAQWAAADGKTSVTLDHFLEHRAEQILKRLGERMPPFAAFLRRRPSLGLLSFVLPLAALLAGAAADHVADPHRVDLLSAPLLLIIAWNLVVYVVLFAWVFVPSQRKGWVSPDLMRRLSVGKSALPRKLPAPLAAALGQYTLDWTAMSWRLTHARLSRTIHLAAAAFALGAILSLYARGLLTAYAAGWESTFLDAGQVHTLLSWLFRPALLVFPMDGFSVADVQALRFVREPSAAGGARWVHLYAATLLLLVVLPRIALAVWSGWRARRLAARFPIDLQQPYYRRLADGVGVGTGNHPGLLRVLPYSFTLDERRSQGLDAIARTLLGASARLMLRPSIAYGDDMRSSLGPADGDTEATMTAALFNLAATPERENQGAFLAALRQREPGAIVLLDESGLAERAGSQPDAGARIAERVALWRQFCSYHGVPATLVSLLEPDKYPLDAATSGASA
jgi:hypothetical protein